MYIASFIVNRSSTTLCGKVSHFCKLTLFCGYNRRKNFWWFPQISSHNGYKMIIKIFPCYCFPNIVSQVIMVLKDTEKNCSYPFISLGPRKLGFTGCSAFEWEIPLIASDIWTLWSSAGITVWGNLGDMVLFEEAHHWRQTVRWKSLAYYQFAFSILGLCFKIWALVSCFCHQACHIQPCYPHNYGL